MNSAIRVLSNGFMGLDYYLVVCLYLLLRCYPVMIKPAMAYLDLIRMAKDTFGFPLAAQNVSGEYAMIKAAGIRGLIDEDEWKAVTLGSIRRAGATSLFEPATLRLLQVVRPIGCFTWSANDKADIYSRKLYQAELPRDICVCH